MKIRFGIFALLMLFYSCSDDGPEVDMPSSTPNIVLIIADDMGWDVFGDFPGTNDEKALTPTLDSLASEGLTFYNFWSNPVCAPTRAALLTGKYGFRTGVGGVQSPQSATLDGNEIILQKALSESVNHGYSSAVIGKWHVSAPRDLMAPEDFGVGYYSGIFLGAVRDYFSWEETSGGTTTNVNTYTTTHFVNQSIDWISNQNNPFFLWLAFNAPHTPFHRPPLELISDQSLSDAPSVIDANPLPYYLASIEAMDREIGRLIGSMSTEIKNNTVFIFLGDNGTPAQVAQSPYQAVGAKGTLFQGGINTPLLVSGLGVSRRGETEEALIQVPDLFATIADLTVQDGSMKEDGMSFKDLLSDASATQREFVYSEQFGNTNGNNDGYAIRNEQYKYIKLDNGREYFYDLLVDPFESFNLLDANLSATQMDNLNELISIKEGL